MNKSIAFATTLVFLFGSMSIASADDGGWMTCRDGIKAHGEGACDLHGGVVIPITASKPIDTTKGFTRTKPTTKPKKKTSTTTGTTRKKAGAQATRSPTAKCNDGAMYFSTERRGACAKHGGVKSWY